MKRFFQRILKRKPPDQLAAEPESQKFPAATPARPSLSPSGEAVRRRVARAAESILENEALTAELDDPAAQAVLAWGEEAARRAALSTADLEDNQAEQELALRLQAVRQMLRAVTRLTSLPADSKATDFEPPLQQFTRLYSQLYGSGAVESDLAALVEQLRQEWSQAADPVERLARLRRLVGQVDQEEPTVEGKL